MAKLITGIVSSNKADKTITVTVLTRKIHPLYRKSYKVSTKYMAHDEKNEAKVGDVVTIKESRPISAKKRHVLNSIVQRAVLNTEDLAVIKDAQPEVAAKEDKK